MGLLQFANRRTDDLYLKLMYGVAFALICVIIYLSYTDGVPNGLLGADSLGRTGALWTDQLSDEDYDNITLPPVGYLVYSNNCRIAKVEVMSDDIRRVYRPRKPASCTKGERFIVKQYNETIKRYRLHMNFHLKSMYVNSSDEISCCYREIVRSGVDAHADNNYILLPCQHIYQDFLVPSSTSYVLVECQSVYLGDIVYQDAHFFIQDSLFATVRRLKSAAAEFKQQQQQFGVLLLGVDSLSQFNIRRTMPLTSQHLKRTKWFELSGYNKIDDNTFPNLMAVLTGLNITRVQEKCPPEEVGGLHNCTLIWNLYQQQNFLTAYGEDEAWMSTFNYLKMGFLHQPTDYYLRPLIMAAENHLPVKTLSGMKFCLGVRSSVEYLYDFAIEFASRYREQRTFGLFWSNTFSHNGWRDPSIMDVRMLAYFKELETVGILNRSVVIFFSDHGTRWGTIRDMPGGFLEERLPMFFIWLPEHMRRLHPEFVYALTVNQHRLTSPYDIHVTLQHLLALANGGGAQAHERLAGSESCPTCQSILLPVAENRSCANAGVVEHWCTCTRYDAVPVRSKKMQEITKLVTIEINTFLKKKSFGSLCARLKLSNINDASYRIQEKAYASDEVFYRVRFEANGHNASFESTFVYQKSSHTITVDVSSISRLDLYEEQSRCIDDKIAKKFCLCKTS